MEILEFLEWRYATKAFNPNKEVSSEKMDILKKAFNLTATSYGLQPIKLVVIKNKVLQQELLEHSMNQKQIATASHVLVFCIQTNIDKAFVKDYFKRVHDLRQTPKEVLKPFEDFLVQDFQQKSQQEIEEWATKQAYLAMGNIMTVCAMEQIDSCPMEGFLSEEYDRVLKLNDHNLKSVLLLPVGYRSENDMFAGMKKVRKPVEDAVLEL
ncbi:NAD(P)H-dependent oxidoreductase [Mangrovimonas sp. YM274]|uniref:NAD(P)H-dependent oxidoreductase n=1 Tax=Mangrovimonas sp. YM274 TaxID=3070660 RepID=UPI0027DE74BF|nr:NAD(P)H-dependent oxidoreductase [Mangrovimonas sp. YM274]WMI70190.1 NAD(P)H-dependent oxidoreductase [Mangrovimonas sp. YM274]